LPIHAPRLIVWVLCHLLVWGHLAAAQDRNGHSAPEPAPAGNSESPAPGSAVPAVEESGPTLYYLKDKDGNLVPMAGFTFEEFKAYYDVKQGFARREQRPRYSLQQMSVAGVAVGNHAELTINFWVFVRREGWVRVPLHFQGAMLREAVVYRGPGEQLMHFEDAGDGYVSWIRGPAGGQHQLTLKMLAPLSKVGDETRLKLVAPRATASELKLSVPVANAVGRVSEGTILLPATDVDGGATEFRVPALSGHFELSWHKPDARIAKIPAVLEAEGRVLVRIDSRSVDTKATLSVQSYGAPFDRFRVCLPAGAELTPGSPADYTVVPIKERENGAQEQGVVEIRLANKTSGPVEVHLATQQLRSTAKASTWFELAGFEVVGAARQSGHLAVAAESDWQVLWGPSRGIRRVDQLPEPLRHEDVLAGFEYLAQPYSLTARLVPKKTRTSVEPEYLLLVDATQLRLEAGLKYTIRGAKVFAFDVALPDWEIDQVGPENVVVADGLAGEDNGMLTIPLAQPSTGQIEVRIVAHRTIAEGAKSLLISLPQPRVDSLGPAALVVVPGDNVRLIPSRAAMAGLVRQQVAPQIEIPERQQDPLFYRGDGTKAVFAADFSILSQEIAVEVNSWLQLERRSSKMEQKLTYMISNEPADALILEVPRSLVESGRLELLHEGQPIAPVALPESAPADDASPVAMRVDLPGGCIGLCELVVRHPVTLPNLLPNQPATVVVPLVMPRDGELTGNKVYVSGSRGIQVRPQPDPWTVSANPAVSGGWQLHSDQRASHVKLNVRWEETDQPGNTVVERAWVQTWLTHVARQDRAVFAFTSSSKELQLTMPTGVALGGMQILLDGQAVAARTTDDGQIVVPLPNDSNRRRRRLEVLSHFPQQQRRPGRMKLEIPRLGPDVWVRRMYWQLVLPKNEHIVAAPRGLTSEFRWGWDDYFWARKPLLEQAQLEAWVDAPGRTPIPDETNRYVFSSFGCVEECELRTAGRSWIVLGASGAALVIGLLLIYVPACRHPGALFALAVTLLCMGVLYPEPMLLISQAASLGLALTLLAGLLERSVARRRREIAAAEPPSSILEKDSTQAPFPSPAADEQTSTETAPTIAPPSNSDSNTS